MAFRSGFVAVLGKANVGKSTLVNALIGKKVSIVSPKPQTTRNQILGIDNGPDYQIIYIDTPGIHKLKNNLDRVMQQAIDEATVDVDLILYVLDGSHDFDEADIKLIKKYASSSATLFVVVNKVDLGTFESIYPRLDKLNKIEGIAEIFGVSAKTGRNLEDLKTAIIGRLNDTVEYFPRDVYSGQDVEFSVSELIREKMLWLLNDEIPHGVGVEIDSLNKDGDLTRISATIYCEKENHKNIIIGKNGAMLKHIGTECRLALEKMLKSKIYLDLFVKVKPNWRDRVKVA